MTRLEDLRPGLFVRGLVPDQVVTLKALTWHGDDAVSVIYLRADGQPGTELLYRASEERLECVDATQSWTFATDAELFKLAAEAYRIHLAHLFDERLAVHTSQVEPLPHQIMAVYDHMLERQPLRFLLADDPGSGKTIMAGLLIRELIVRGDVRRCLICAPGNLTEQWQDELWQKFQLHFHILSRETVETSRTGNPFAEHDLAIVRLDQVSRSEEWQRKLEQTEWDLIVCDEAHKMSASFFGSEIKETKRYRLGKLFGQVTRHLLLMTATPHNGKEEDFQLFLALLDPDRFAGRFRGGVERVDVSDLMRRMVKERLLRFDGTPLFPERRAYTVNYGLSPEENELYEQVTAYVREQFNRADKLENDGRKGTVGFALTILQRRLASSPEAIYQSLRRRRERLEERLQEEIANQHGLNGVNGAPLEFDEDTWEDLDEKPDEELERLEDEVVDSATAARTIDELKKEIDALEALERTAMRVLRSGHDRKWRELEHLLHENPHMRDGAGHPRKLVIFTEHRDTLNYLRKKLITRLGAEEPVVCIHGGLRREDRRAIEAEFKNNPAVSILVATDAAGEGINLQRAHLMVNYDLPWNPNRLEQRFGRIHRIGQTEVCHLWNLVAPDTREGHVYARLLAKLKAERDALNGQVFDVLGEVVWEKTLRELMIEAIRYGDDPAVRQRLDRAVDNAIEQLRMRELLEQRSLVQSTMDLSQVLKIREDMERYAAKRLQPHYIKAFFLSAFEQLGGKVFERERGRYTINNVPAVIRNWAREHGLLAVASSYSRICFEKADIQRGESQAEFICPGHPLLDATVGLTLERYRDALKAGSVLVDPTDPGREPRMLFFLEQTLRDGRLGRDGARRVISRQVHFVEVDASGAARVGGGAPYLDYRAATESERARLAALLPGVLGGEGFGAKQEAQASDFAIAHLVPAHLEDVRAQRLALIARTEAAVQERLTAEAYHWDTRATELRVQELAGRPNARLNSQRAQQRADELWARLDRRKAELQQERQISAEPPVIVGGTLVVPIGLLLDEPARREMLEARITEHIALRAVLAAERALGHDPRDVSADKLGYDVESRDGASGQLRFIEVKGRRIGADTVTITCNEILKGLNVPEQFVLALVEVDGAQAAPPRYVRRPFGREPDAGVESVNYDLRKLLAQGGIPS